MYMMYKYVHDIVHVILAAADADHVHIVLTLLPYQPGNGERPSLAVVEKVSYNY
jgi:hypothetical protein